MSCSVSYWLLGSTGYIDAVSFFACARGLDLAANRTQSRAHLHFLLPRSTLARGGTKCSRYPKAPIPHQISHHPMSAGHVYPQMSYKSSRAPAPQRYLKYYPTMPLGWLAR
jgi:hypothetical protein